MGRGLAESSPAARRVFEAADEILAWPLSQLCSQGPEAELIQTENLQPALFVVSLAALRAAEDVCDLSPFAALGHSLGEYSALVAAGALRFEDGLRAVRARGEFMARAVPAGLGGMAAVIGLEADSILAVCQQTSKPDSTISLANFNSPGQAVVSGHLTAIARAEPLLKQAGARGLVRLKVSAPFHSALMRPAADQLAEVLADVPFSAPAYSVLCNVTGKPHTDPDSIRARLVEQVTSPVRWIDCVTWCLDQGADRFLELGSGKVLVGLLKRIERKARAQVITDLDDLARLGEFTTQEETA